MAERVLTIDLVRHMKAKNRQKWTAPQDERPLSKLGLRQAVFHADALLAGERIEAIYTSPAVRCRATIAPMAEQLGVEARVEPLLAEGRSSQEAMRLLGSLRERHESGRIVLCSHGDTIPAMLAGIGAENGASAPAGLSGFGGWYRVRFDGDGATIVRFGAPEGFPAGK